MNTSASATTTTLDLVTLIIAVIGLVMGAVSLAWQMWTFRSEGPLVRVVARRMMLVPGGFPVIDVVARNVGRSPVLINGWGFTTKRRRRWHRRSPGFGFVIPTPDVEGSARPPIAVAGGHDVSFMISERAFETGVSDERITGPVFAWVTLATGKTVQARKPVPPD